MSTSFSLTTRITKCLAFSPMASILQTPHPSRTKTQMLVTKAPLKTRMTSKARIKTKTAEVISNSKIKVVNEMLKTI